MGELILRQVLTSDSCQMFLFVGFACSILWLSFVVLFDLKMIYALWHEKSYLPSLLPKLLLECMFFPVPNFEIIRFKIQVWNFRKMSYSYLYPLKYWHYSIYIFECRLPITFFLKVIFVIHVLFLSWLIN